MIRINKKAQGMPVNVIIIAALALIVLVVLVVIFSGRVRIFSITLEDCEAKQGSCKTGCDPNTEAKITNVKCPKEKSAICCVPVFNQP